MGIMRILNTPEHTVCTHAALFENKTLSLLRLEMTKSHLNLHLNVTNKIQNLTVLSFKLSSVGLPDASTFLG